MTLAGPACPPYPWRRRARPAAWGAHTVSLQMFCVRGLSHDRPHEVAWATRPCSTGKLPVPRFLTPCASLRKQTLRAPGPMRLFLFGLPVQREYALFAFSDGSLLDGAIEPRHEKLLRWWFVRAQPRLVEIWNQARPSGCPVGTIKEGGSQQEGKWGNFTPPEV